MKDTWPMRDFACFRPNLCILQWTKQEMELFLLLSPMEWVNKIETQLTSLLGCGSKSSIILQLKNAEKPHHKLREQGFRIPLERAHIEDPILAFYLTLERQISCYCLSKLPSYEKIAGAWLYRQKSGLKIILKAVASCNSKVKLIGIVELPDAQRHFKWCMFSFTS